MAMKMIVENASKPTGHRGNGKGVGGHRGNGLNGESAFLQKNEDASSAEDDVGLEWVHNIPPNKKTKEERGIFIRRRICTFIRCRICTAHADGTAAHADADTDHADHADHAENVLHADHAGAWHADAADAWHADAWYDDARHADPWHAYAAGFADASSST